MLENFNTQWRFSVMNVWRICSISLKTALIKTLIDFKVIINDLFQVYWST